VIKEAAILSSSFNKKKGEIQTLAHDNKNGPAEQRAVHCP